MKKLALTLLLLLNSPDLSNKSIVKSASFSIKSPTVNMSVVDSCFEKAKKIRYMSDDIRNPETGDYWQSYKETDSLGTGDCEDKAIYLYTLLEKNNIESRLVFGFLSSSDSSSYHIWLELDSKDTTYSLDPTARGLQKIFIKEKILPSGDTIKGTRPKTFYSQPRYTEYIRDEIFAFKFRNNQYLKFKSEK